MKCRSCEQTSEDLLCKSCQTIANLAIESARRDGRTKIECADCHKEYAVDTIAKGNGICGNCRRRTSDNDYRKVTIPLPVRREVWLIYASQTDLYAPCYVCGTTISVWDFQCAHVIAESDGGLTTIENLRPTCAACNQSMRTMNLDDFKKQHFNRRYRRACCVIV